MTENRLWQTKVAARLHDPAEKSLVLLRDPQGHENGTSRALSRLLGFDRIVPDSPIEADNEKALVTTVFKKGIPADMYRHVQRADWWAAAADRPQFPMDEITVPLGSGEQRSMAVSRWAQVNWARDPVLIHPLTGEKFNLKKLGGLASTPIEAVKTRSWQHFSELARRLGAGQGEPSDWRKLLLGFWRFGPEQEITEADTADHDQLGELWKVLPADTRIPDHSIWDHLDLTSAFAGAFAADVDGEAALLTLSIGPVQPFIAAARTTSDLWAGSHLLSRLSWEAMRPICEQLGPDAILFPRLRGIPQVDLWLREQMGLPSELFEHCDWQSMRTDANPLFSAALPNRFVAVVPASQARAIVQSAEQAVRQWLHQLGEQCVDELLDLAGLADQQGNCVAYEQMLDQLRDFPEIHWAVVPFSLIRCRNKQKQRDLDFGELSAAMRPFFVDDGTEPGFLGSSAWQVLSEDIELVDENGRKTVFMSPNPGALYPAVFDLAERALAAAKTCRQFTQTGQEGWRCTLTGENEWLTTDREQLYWNQTYRQNQQTLWTRIASTRKSLVKEGEHLSALPAIKRLWPTLFKRQVDNALGIADSIRGESVSRFVVSTHTMALAHQLATNLDMPVSDDLKAHLHDQAYRVALPRKLANELHRSDADFDALARIPGWLDAARESDDESMQQAVQREIQGLLGGKVETYYSLIMMDGDRMGAILSGDESTGTAISYLDSFHPTVRDGFEERADKHEAIRKYGTQRRAMTPNRHLSISGALNDFSQIVAPHVVEEEYLGRLIYAGGDDVLAMLPVADMLPVMQRLRDAYSGVSADGDNVDWGELRGRKTLVCKGGFAWLDGRLMRMMGEYATASCGAIIAHHQAPLSAVLRELRNAEKRAKSEGQRDAFSIAVIKRSGGALYLTEKWGRPLEILGATRDFLSGADVSRRAVYHTLEWLKENELPLNAFDTGMAQHLLLYQLSRQASGSSKAQAPVLAQALADLATQWPAHQRVNRLRNFLSVAEFLARETRKGAES